VGPEEILLLLREGLEPWPEILRRLRISRSELLGALRALQEEGFPVVVEEGGAGLLPGSPAPQFLLPRLKGKFGRPYRYLGRVTSTQDVLAEWREAPEGALVVAECQTRGRGRLGRPWESPPGNLYFSVLLEEADPLLPLRAGLALIEAVGFGLLEWPNDLLSPDGRKMGGILVERSGSRVLLGVGINVARAPIPASAAISEFKSCSRVQLLADFLWSLENWLSRENEEVLSHWKSQNVTLGREVVVRVGKHVIFGKAVDLGPQGELILHTENGIAFVRAGDVGFP